MRARGSAITIRQQHEHEPRHASRQRQSSRDPRGPRAGERRGAGTRQQAAALLRRWRARSRPPASWPAPATTARDRDPRRFEQSGRGLEVRLRRFGRAAGVSAKASCPRPRSAANDLAEVLSRVVEALHRLIDGRCPRRARARSAATRLDARARSGRGPAGRPARSAGGRRARELTASATSSCGASWSSRRASGMRRRAASRGRRRARPRPSSRRGHSAAPSRTVVLRWAALRAAACFAMLLARSTAKPVERRGVARDRRARVGPCGLRAHERTRRARRRRPGDCGRASQQPARRPRRARRKHDRDRRQTLGHGVDFAILRPALSATRLRRLAGHQELPSASSLRRLKRPATASAPRR